MKSAGFVRLWTALWTVAALYLSLRGLSGAFLVGDEFHTLRDLGASFLDLARSYDEHGSGLVLPLLQKGAALLLGPSPLAYRLPAVVGAVGTVLLVGPVARALCSPASALLATAAVATSTIHVFYSRYGRAYSLAACLVLLLVLCIERSLSGRASRASRAGIVLAGGLLPAVHLSTAPLFLALGLAAAWNARRRGCLRSVAIPLLGAGLLALLLHLPAAPGLRAFLGQKVLEGVPEPFTPVDVAALLAGGRFAGWVALVATPLAMGLYAARRGPAAWLALAGPSALVLALVVSQPPGLSYAYARYLFAGWPLLLMVLAWSWMELAGRSASRPWIGLALGLAVLVVPRASDLAARAAPDGRFSNTNLALMPVPAFDVPWPRASQFYAVLARSSEPTRIAEFPALKTRNLLLYRSHWRLHGQDVLLGHAGDALLAPLGAPYVDVASAEALASAGVEYVVVHHDVDDELANYWSFVRDEAWPVVREAGDDAPMAAHSDWGPRTGHGADVPRAEAALRSSRGDPVYEDATVRVWRVR